MDYGFILPILNEADLEVDCIERLRIRIISDGLDISEFEFFRYDYVPIEYRDSFSNQFVGEKIVCIIGKRNNVLS